MKLMDYIGERFPKNFAVTRESNGIIVIRDTGAAKGNGYKISVTEESSFIEGQIEFEDYAKELSAYAQARLSAPDNEIRSMYTGHPRLYASVHRYTVEDLFADNAARDNGWSLRMGYRRTGSYPLENFTDLLLSFTLLLFPYDVAAEEEGMPDSVLATGYERSLRNRALCIAFHGYDCKACGENMRGKYGEVARKFIHVHHLHPLAQSPPQTPDPIRDMVPLCPNCHGIAHLRNPPYTISEIQQMINRENERIYPR